MPLALVTGAARTDSIAAAIVPRLAADGWEVATSDLADVDYPCDLSTSDGPQQLVDSVSRDRGPITATSLRPVAGSPASCSTSTAGSRRGSSEIGGRAWKELD
jgi:3-oxoacyl-[acyl-carrier protein] reductase